MLFCCLQEVFIQCPDATIVPYAFQGRVPRSILAMHYTDYSLDSLKQIYDKAGLRVLS